METQPIRPPEWTDFSNAEGTVYTVRGHPLTLLQAELFEGAGRPGGSFRLEFRGPAEPVLPQDIYEFSAGVEPLEIFIVPVSSDRAGTIYEAIFN